jgi:hypothetical protein
MDGNRYLVNERGGEQVLESWTSGYDLFILPPSVACRRSILPFVINREISVRPIWLSLDSPFVRMACRSS